jgi:hypothetical protein
MKSLTELDLSIVVMEPFVHVLSDLVCPHEGIINRAVAKLDFDIEARSLL